MKKGLLLLMLCFVFNLAKSQTKTNKKNGDPSLVSTSQDLLNLYSFEKGRYGYSVEDYFRKPKQYSFKFSPNGLYVSYRKRDYDGKNHLYIKNTTTGKVKQVITEEQDLVTAYAWASNDKLIYLKSMGGDAIYHLYSVDVSGRNTLYLTPFEGVKVRFLDKLSEQKDYVIVSMNIDNKQVFEPYRININTGEYKKLYENKDIKNPIQRYYFDNTGALKAYSQQQNGTEQVLFYRLSEQSPFEEVLRSTWRDKFYVIKFNYETANPHDAYIISNMDSDKSKIILYDFQHRAIVKELYSNKTYDITGLSVASAKRNYEIDYYYYEGDKHVVVPESKTFKKIFKKIEDEFKDKNIYIISKTENEDKFLLKISSDRLYGKYYVYDSDKETFTLVIDVMPHLQERDMAEMKPIKFKSRDGLTIHGFLSIPKGISEGTRIPLIVLPHGGPYGVRDKWGFHSKVQLFASRGYATLQVNFRGSGGYGKEFYLAGSKQIGRAMLEDIQDALVYVKTKNIIDETKVAIYGVSYGGLAALGSLVKTPNLFTCAIDYAGLSSLFTFIESFPPYWKPFLEQVREQWYDDRDPAEIDIMKQISPAHNLDKINKPVFVIQGGKDPRIKVEETDFLVKQLRSQNLFVPYMLKYNEGHGFSKEENKIEMYKCVMGFLAKYLK